MTLTYHKIVGIASYILAQIYKVRSVSLENAIHTSTCCSSIILQWNTSITSFLAYCKRQVLIILLHITLKVLLQIWNSRKIPYSTLLFTQACRRVPCKMNPPINREREVTFQVHFHTQYSHTILQIQTKLTQATWGKTYVLLIDIFNLQHEPRNGREKWQSWNWMNEWLEKLIV